MQNSQKTHYLELENSSCSTFGFRHVLSYRIYINSQLEQMFYQSTLTSAGYLESIQHTILILLRTCIYLTSGMYGSNMTVHLSERHHQWSSVLQKFSGYKTWDMTVSTSKSSLLADLTQLIFYQWEYLK